MSPSASTAPTLLACRARIGSSSRNRRRSSAIASADCVPRLRVLLDRLQDDRLQVARDAGVEGRGRAGSSVLISLDQLEPVGRLEGRPQREQLVEGQPQGVDVGCGRRPSPRNRSGAM